jgi:hypothetical protein
MLPIMAHHLPLATTRKTSFAPKKGGDIDMYIAKFNGTKAEQK